MSDRPRDIANDMIDAIQSATAKWTKQRKSEERHPGNVRWRRTRMTAEPHTSQKAAAWSIMRQAYMAASGGGRLPASARQIYYQARPKIMALTENKELGYNYFSQNLLPNYIEQRGVIWDVVYDARGHFSEPHTNRQFGCGTLEVANYLAEMRDPKLVPPAFTSTYVDVIGPAGNISGVLYCEKEGFGPLFRAVKLADRYDLMIISNKGVSVTAARRLVNDICGRFKLPLFVLHDFDLAGFMILGTWQRDTRRFQFSRDVEVIDLGLRFENITGLEKEPAAATKVRESIRRRQLAQNGATAAEIEFVIKERVELNALTSEALIAMIENELAEYGLEKVVPDTTLLASTYQAFHRSALLRERFKALEEQFNKEAIAAVVPDDLEESVREVLTEHPDLRWDHAVQLVLDPTQLDRLREEKGNARRKAGDFTHDDVETSVRAVLGRDHDDDADDDDTEGEP